MAEIFQKTASINTILITGPTASGKSQLGVKIARLCNGIVINTDSMQVYDGLYLLTARPNVEEMVGVSHFLYGCVRPDLAFSAGLWLEKVGDLLQKPDLYNRVRIFVGGTGLYFRALLGGLSPIPPIPPEIREKWRYFLNSKGAKALHRYLGMRDPSLAKRFSFNDGQRIIRALEVLEATGCSLALWQKIRTKAFIDFSRTYKMVLAPDRNWLAERISTRFNKMLERNVLEEIQKVQSMNLNPQLPVMKAIGMREFGEVLEGKVGLEEALFKAKTKTRRYAKRQITWQRQLLDAGWQKFSSGEEGLKGALSQDIAF